MDAVESDKKVYLFYQAPYQSNMDYLGAFKDNLKVNKAYNGEVVYHPRLAVIELQKNTISPATIQTSNRLLMRTSRQDKDN